MKLLQIRNATLKLTDAGKVLLTGSMDLVSMENIMYN